ncbi:helix-hairpin-helix domain-containing protein, partial [Francisella tularensis]|nr:DNA polymerase III subunit alpha [Francisella tularensis]
INKIITVIAPNVNKSVYDCIAVSKGTILLGLGAIKELGGESIKSILTERDIAGEFSYIFDLCRRVDLRKVNKKALEALCYAGAIKEIYNNRAQEFHSSEKDIKNASYVNEMNDAAKDDLFGCTEKES